MREQRIDPTWVWLGLFASMMFAGSMAADSPPAAPAPALGTLSVAPDLADELAKFKRVAMPFDVAALNARERRMIGKLVEACRYLDRIYWQQSDPAGLALYRQLGTHRSTHAPAP